jgi:hypothetical protein
MPQNFIPVEFDVGSDMVVVGFNSESADYDNPRGALHAIQPYVRAIDARGNTMVKYSTKTYHVADEKQAHADAEIVAISLRLKLANRLKPNFDKWQVGRPVYGSEAYIEYGQDDDLALERQEAEDEAFA